MKEAFQYHRIVWLHTRMKRGSVGWDDYQDEFGLSRRSLSRDIEWLGNRFNAPVIVKHGRYTYSDQTFDLPQMAVTRDEVIALYNAIPLIEEFQGTPVYDTLAKVVHSVGHNGLNDEYSGDMRMSRLNRKEIGLDWEVFSVIAKAIGDKETLSMEYHSLSSSSVTMREIDPYHVYVYESEFYLAGYCHVRGEVRDFNLQRIKKLERTGKSFTFLDDFSLSDYLGRNRWGIMKGGKVEEVTVKIKEDRVYEVTEDFPSKFREIKDSTEELSMSDPGGWRFFVVEADISNEFINWILSKHGDVVVLAPESVKRKVKEVCARILKVYK
ncbi:MAG: helix-turn-helix transcriptional regulator [Candidatus Dojkabacteria bacterium]